MWYNKIMRTINIFSETRIETPAPLNLYFEGLKYGVLDIETTGLYPQRNKLILGGLLYDDEARKGTRLQQFFAHSREEEEDVIRAYLQALSEIDCVITYNGTYFDIPFIIKRAELYGIDISGKIPANVDLYNILDRYSSLRSVLPNLRQKTVEVYAGIASSRKDEISGGESVKLYNRFCKTESEELAKEIILHNSDDILQLSKLLPVTKKADIHRAMFELGFCCAEKMYVSQIRINKKSLVFKGKQGGKNFDYSGAAVKDGRGHILFDAAARTFDISVPIFEYQGMKLIDLIDMRAGTSTQSFTALEKYPFYGSGYLAISHNGKNNYREMNHFIKIYIDDIIREVLTDEYKRKA